MRNYRRHLGPKFSEGARLLWGRLRKEKLTIAEAAKLLGWTRSALTTALYGDRVRSDVRLIEVWRAFRVAPHMWHRAPRREFTVPALEVRP